MQERVGTTKGYSPKVQTEARETILRHLGFEPSLGLSDGRQAIVDKFDVDEPVAEAIYDRLWLWGGGAEPGQT
jgi:hypothetical protein